MIYICIHNISMTKSRWEVRHSMRIFKFRLLKFSIIARAFHESKYTKDLSMVTNIMYVYVKHVWILHAGTKLKIQSLILNFDFSKIRFHDFEIQFIAVEQKTNIETESETVFRTSLIWRDRFKWNSYVHFTRTKTHSICVFQWN